MVKDREARRCSPGPQEFGHDGRLTTVSLEPDSPEDTFSMLQVQAGPAADPSYLITNLVWLQEGEVTLTPSELPNYTMLWEDEKAVCTTSILGKHVIKPKEGFPGSEGPSCQRTFSGPSHGPDAFILVKGSFPEAALGKLALL